MLFRTIIRALSCDSVIDHLFSSNANKQLESHFRLTQLDQFSELSSDWRAVDNVYWTNEDLPLHAETVREKTANHYLSVVV